MTKHTPGPWRASPPEFIRHGCMGIFSAGDCNILPPKGNAGPVAIAAGAANARLIAAAPDMLAALKSYIADYENPAQTCHNGYTAEKARAAIAKAEPGQSPSDAQVADYHGDIDGDGSLA